LGIDCNFNGDRMRKITLFIFLTTLFCLSNCDLPHQPGPQPSELVKTEFEAGLNILGVLRADEQKGTSFININRALTTEEIYSDSIENFSPRVDYVKISSIISGAEYLFIQDEDTRDSGDYRDTTLNVGYGEAYELEISAPGFPMLTSNTRVPEKPSLVENSLSLGSGNVTFQIQHDISAFEYKLYLIFAETALEKVIKPTGESLIGINWDYESSSGAPVYLILSALDENLTRYGNSPISFIPNTYHPDGSTVHGGYGCFGSVAITLLELN